jgi:plastocyanin domain-containing protein
MSMSADEIVVTLAGLAAIACVAWFFWGPRRAGVQAALTTSGRQEATIVVKGAYNPDVIVVEHGKPVRLTFLRQETAACSEEVVFPDFARRAQLPEGKLVTVDLVPDEAGEYEFTCGMGMLRGKLVVT